MIGRLRGELVYKQPPFLMVDVNGVGYELEAPMSTFYDLPLQGGQVTLFTHLAIREDAHVLYGFISDSERALFRTLLKVSGVGAKMALAILSGMSAEEFALCIQRDDTAALVRLPGIGKKTAERLIVEMRDRLDRIEPVSGVSLPRAQSTGVAVETPQSDALGALIALGYKPNDASRMVRSVECENLSSEEIIRLALRAVVTKS
ncbi:Holliday junction branch migration protein RuvA [Sedimenticola selenatireducens]|jgi:Holliday junction DNA helicase RuvA|uniref:Holliday junction branch migration complex subunit RuvA n=1 Tax=Sedimenticola selenatireducens TaxID=191960 RepID=A0A557SDT4_9GAMM|nr:Holliday junction branch migration protein RuvA [Sedimenticola selenatireducens]TVO75543.1 Holliday junction branch migration protein RuvA [Sedimenticola selenatireducens]TVT65449.1 MAG: Holliday junction branch migration protein RuvA [Sedimenticola selenatireducens]